MNGEGIPRFLCSRGANRNLGLTPVGSRECGASGCQPGFVGFVSSFRRLRKHARIYADLELLIYLKSLTCMDTQNQSK